MTVAAKLDAPTIARIDDIAQRFAPFIDGRSQAMRILLEVALAAIDNGTLPNSLDGLQEILRGEPRAPRIVKAGSR